MELCNLSPSYVRAIAPYQPGKPIAELAREMGLNESDIVKLASNENPLGVSPRALAAIQGQLEDLARYPDGSGYYLRRKLSEKYGLPFAGIVLGNGSNEIIELIIRAFLLPGDEAIMPAPSFLVYSLAVQCMAGKAVPVALRDFAIDTNRTQSTGSRITHHVSRITFHASLTRRAPAAR